ncbi:MAG TPA: hypothetical protein VEL07_10585 [Planctomycetota bacterium]|nr:hypothetical protein [Planctomycetota bacterium]
MILRRAGIVALALAPVLAPAMESDIRVVHLRVEGDTELSTPAGDDRREWDDAERWGLQYLLVLRVPIVGVHVGVEASSEERADQGVDYTVAAGHLVAGARVSLFPIFLHLEANGQAGYGIADLDLHGRDNDDGNWVGYSLGLDLVGSVPIATVFTIEAGIGGGWLTSESSHSIDGVDHDVRAPDNLYGRIFVGVRF